ncbi:thioesterase family protein [Actinoplanes nipponensis]|uniref:thioesterase family protein n=1 Tax=Actinoplanes nipponensis TaxID=135950 RepID=UPI0019432E55|nr:thioesterase family protein [Actinoplanes nipponensis]
MERTADGKYRAEVTEDWKMWVPVGGYLSAIALRAAQASSSMFRPVSITTHYLSEATFGPAELEVTPLLKTERADSHLVKMTQNGKDILVAMVSGAATGHWSPNVTWREAPQSPRPEELEDTILDGDVVELMGEEPFWKNIEFRMIRGLNGPHDYPNVDHLTPEQQKYTPRRDAHIRGWQRMRGGEGLTDPWVDAGRYLIITAAMQFPVVADPFTPPLTFIAPTLNLTVDFHTFHPEAGWLLADANGTYVGDGVLGADTRLWTEAGELLVTANSQMTYHDFSEPKVNEGKEKNWFELRDS